MAFQTNDVNGETVSTESAKFNFDSIIENMREFTRLMREKYKKVVCHRTSLKLAQKMVVAEIPKEDDSLTEEDHVTEEDQDAVTDEQDSDEELGDDEDMLAKNLFG